MPAGGGRLQVRPRMDEVREEMELERICKLFSVPTTPTTVPTEHQSSTSHTGAVQVQRGIDDTQMAEGLGKVAEHALATRVVLLGEQADIITAPAKPAIATSQPARCSSQLNARSRQPSRALKARAA